MFRRGDATWLDLLGDGTILHSVRRQPPRPRARAGGASPMRAIDHVTYCLPYDALDRVARAYQDVLGLVTIPGPGRDVGDDATGMRSAVLRAATGFTVVLTEPMSRDSTGQTQRFLAARGGAGVQHLALAYDDLAAAVTTLRARGVSFLPVHTHHLDLSYARVGDRPLPWDVLRREGISSTPTRRACSSSSSPIPSPGSAGSSSSSFTATAPPASAPETCARCLRPSTRQPGAPRRRTPPVLAARRNR